MSEDARHRKRVRGAPPSADHTQADSAGRWGGGTRGDGGGYAERGPRGLVGAGPSQVELGAAMRARDASRPTQADLLAAEEEIVIVRRHWHPPDSDHSPPESAPWG